MSRVVRSLASQSLLIFVAFYLPASLCLPADFPQLIVDVKDPSGAPMQASISLRSTSGGGERHVTTDARGVTTLNKLSPGEYTLTVSEPGFLKGTSTVTIPATGLTQRTVTLSISEQATRIQVVSSSPAPESGILLKDMARPAQVASKLDIIDSGSIDLADLLTKRLNSVYSTETQGNPFQPDINYRGYTASPLLGTPQGLSVFLDGVRMNQPFGDVVSWDLIPKVAIAEVSLIPGSDPLFGLNTLGGALSVRTKDGATNPGTNIELSGGSYGRRSLEAEHGGFLRPNLSYYAATNLFFEDGWRAASPTDVRQFFGKLSWQGSKTAAGVSLGYVNNSLTGNGLQDYRLLQADYASIYTKPDITNNRSPFVNFTGSHSFSPTLSAFGNAYYRYVRTRTLNGDINEDSLDQSVYQPSAADIRALRAAGYTGFPTSGANVSNTPFPKWRCIAQALEGDEPGEKCNGLLNTTASGQHNFGLFGRLYWQPLGGRNQIVFGGGYDRSHVDFSQLAQLGYLNPDRSVTGVNAFGDGITGGNVDGTPYDTRVNLASITHTTSLYAADTFKIRNNLTLTLSGRFNYAVIDNSDRINPGGGPGSLDGRNTFGRFNPSIGLTYSPFRFLGAYASYSESSRTPTSIELGCADSTQPCKLPNALAGDPPLKQVVTRSWEAGLRGGAETSFGWSAGWFRAVNRNDLLFVSSTQTGFGYFRNFGKTLREGAEISVNSRIRRLTVGGGYTFLDATYQSPEALDGSSNSSNQLAQSGSPGLEANIAIQPGDQIPLTPRHLVKAYADIRVTSRLSLDVNELAVSKSFARGNENNLSQPNPPYYLGPGYSPGYALLNLGARLRISRWAEGFVQVNNLMDRRYYTAAQLGPAGFTAAGNFVARPLPAQNGDFPLQHATFYAPGAPRGVWGGVRLHF